MVEHVLGGKVLFLHAEGDCLPLDIVRMLDSMGLPLNPPCTPEWTEGGEYPW